MARKKGWLSLASRSDNSPIKIYLCWNYWGHSSRGKSRFEMVSGLGNRSFSYGKKVLRWAINSTTSASHYWKVVQLLMDWEYSKCQMDLKKVYFSRHTLAHSHFRSCLEKWSPKPPIGCIPIKERANFLKHKSQEQ